MIRRLHIIPMLWLFVTITVTAQDASGQLLSRINNLRSSVGLSGYTVNSALAAAANNQASWMVTTGKVSHTQDNGSGPRTRAQNAGYSSNFVSENIYMGSDASIESAWNFWVNSPIHYAGMTSPNYDNIGIGSASGANGYAYVLVFGNSAGSLPQSASRAGNRGNSNAAPEPPSFVVGVDGVGNIMHEVQPGDTFGDIALIYGYTWEDIPYMLSINGMSEADIPYLGIGSVILVPPQEGTYTPTVAPPSPTDDVTATPTKAPSTATPTTVQIIPPATFVLQEATATRAVSVRALPTLTATPTTTPQPIEEPVTNRQENSIQSLLIIAIVIQVGIIGIAAVEFFRRHR